MDVFPYPGTAVLNLIITIKHAGGGGRSPVLTLVRADATTSRDGLPFSVGCGISSVKVTHNTEDAAMHADLAVIQH